VTTITHWSFSTSRGSLPERKRPTKLARALRLAFQMRGGFHRCQAVRQKRNPGVPPRLSLRLSAVWGTIIGLVISDARASDCISIFREVTASTKRPKFTQQSRQRGCVAASGFASSPIRAVFLDSNRWVVELTVKGSNLHLVPQSSVRGRANPTSQS